VHVAYGLQQLFPRDNIKFDVYTPTDGRFTPYHGTKGIEPVQLNEIKITSNDN